MYLPSTPTEMRPVVLECRIYRYRWQLIQVLIRAIPRRVEMDNCWNTLDRAFRFHGTEPHAKQLTILVYRLRSDTLIVTTI